MLVEAVSVREQWAAERMLSSASGMAHLTGVVAGERSVSVEAIGECVTT